MSESTNTRAFRSPHVPPRSCPLPKIRGPIGPAPEHFVVEELPAYPLSDAGEHVFLWIEKIGLNTLDVAKRLADLSSTRERDIGYAGMKDKHAITRQWFSVLYKGDDAAAFDLGEGVRVLEARRHNNKLRTGHLIGNRFTITLVGSSEEDTARTQAIVEYIRKFGVANYYGGQRFGYQGKNLASALKWLDEQGKEAHPEHSQAELPVEFAPKSRNRRFKKPSRFDNKLHPSVIQSEFFNRYTQARLTMPDALLRGEVVRLNKTGTHFVVQDLETELPRKLSGDLILTGAMPGPKTLSSEHEAAQLEQTIWDQMGLSLGQIKTLFEHAPGARRDLIIVPEALEFHAQGDHIVLSFSLPAGGYATQLVREFNEADWMNPRPKTP